MTISPLRTSLNTRTPQGRPTWLTIGARFGWIRPFSLSQRFLLTLVVQSPVCVIPPALTNPSIIINSKLWQEFVHVHGITRFRIMHYN